MNYEIEDEPAPPAPDGRAPRGPKGRPHHRELDDKAIAGIKAGEYKSTNDAAKKLAPFYNSANWRDKNQDQRENYVKFLKRKYDKRLARLGS